MDNPKKDGLSKVVLNVTTYKQIDGSAYGYPEASTVDITDVLAKAGFDLSKDVPGLVNGVSQYGDSGIVHTHFVVPEQNLHTLMGDINGIMEAAIVNTKQLKAVQNLVEAKFNEFTYKMWEQIRNGDVL